MAKTVVTEYERHIAAYLAWAESLRQAAKGPPAKDAAGQTGEEPGG